MLFPLFDRVRGKLKRHHERLETTSARRETRFKISVYSFVSGTYCRVHEEMVSYICKCVVMSLGTISSKLSWYSEVFKYALHRYYMHSDVFSMFKSSNMHQYEKSIYSIKTIIRFNYNYISIWLIK